MQPTLHIELLGDFRLTLDGEPVTSVNTARLQSLLAYLVLHGEAPQQRQHLAARFWPDSTSKQSRTNLRHLLHHLRRALPEADRFIAADTHTLQWRPETPVALDVEAFDRTIGRADAAAERRDAAAGREALEAAARLYRGDLLPSCYDEWIEPERERLRQQHIATLDRLVRLLEEQRNYAAAIRHGRRLLQKDPLREVTYRCLMRLHALCGDRAGALRTYHECATVLERELSVAPDAATREVREQLLNLEASSELEPEPAAPLTAELPLVDRQQEWKQLLDAWRTATRGQARFVSVAGEAGIGKTRLAEELLTWAGRQGYAAARTRCYAAEGRLAFAPVADLLRSDALREFCSKVDAVWCREVARVLPDPLSRQPDLQAPEPMTENWQRQRLFEALARAVLAARHPLLLVIDDLQWCDRDTIEWLRYLLRFDRKAELLIVGTVRIEEIGTSHPLRTLRRNLRRAGQLTEIVLQPLGEADTAALAGRVAERDLVKDQAVHLYRETEGNPLFVVESVRAEMVEPRERGASRRPEYGSSHSNRAPLPPKVHAVLSERLAQLSGDAHALANVAATVGRAFTYEVLAEATGHDDEHLAQALDELWQRRIVREQGPGRPDYDFSHDKLREVAYSEIPPARQRLLHRRVATALETVYAADLDGVSAQLAAHYEHADRPDQAIPYYRRAAELARRVYANEEAISHLHRALELLERLPRGPDRDEREVSLRAALGPLLIATKGWADPDVGRMYARAHAMSSPEPAAQHFPVHWGLQIFYLVRTELQAAHELAEQFLHRVQQQNDPVLLAAGHLEMGIALFHLGELVRAREHLEQTISLYDPLQHRAQAFFGPDPGAFSRAYLSHVLWHLGKPDQALEKSGEALALADELAHPFSRAVTLDYASMLHQFRGESPAALERAEEAVALCAEKGFPYYQAWAEIMQGWGQAQQGRVQKGMTRMRRGLAALQDTGARLRRPYYLTLLAETCLQTGKLEDGLALLAEAEAVTLESKERWREVERRRLRGELLLAQRADRQEVEQCFQQALDLAHRQRNRALELRAAMSLSRLWKEQGRRDDAHELLEGIYDAFREGHDAPDFRQARTLLAALA